MKLIAVFALIFSFAITTYAEPAHIIHCDFQHGKGQWRVSVLALEKGIPSRAEAILILDHGIAGAPTWELHDIYNTKLRIESKWSLYENISYISDLRGYALTDQSVLHISAATVLEKSITPLSITFLGELSSDLPILDLMGKIFARCQYVFVANPKDLN